MDGAVFVQKDVGGFDVAMDHLAVMQELNCTEQVVHNRFDVQQLQVQRAFDDFLKVALSVVQHQVDAFERGGAPWVDDLPQPHKLGVFQKPHQRDLTQNALAVCHVIEDVVHAFDRYFLPRRPVRRAHNLAIAALTQELLDGVGGADLPVTELI